MDGHNIVVREEDRENAVVVWYGIRQFLNLEITAFPKKAL